ncbi:anti-repressor SinI family protein [Oceanobacillus damuensis]|uniref:anti-repressor SinI family protein n=1 Tax=Oceanobacillus damuensis TaxID=937928 RepID=UPI0009FFE55E|nr:anti-repressor SinI family protein [Oceanobacillus damuensis]
MHSQRSFDISELDQEWLQLIREARNIGLSIEEVSNFLQQKSNSKFILHRNPEVKHSGS